MFCPKNLKDYNRFHRGARALSKGIYVTYMKKIHRDLFKNRGTGYFETKAYTKITVTLG